VIDRVEILKFNTREREGGGVETNETTTTSMQDTTIYPKVPPHHQGVYILVVEVTTKA